MQSFDQSLKAWSPTGVFRYENAVFIETSCGLTGGGVREVAELIRSLRPQLPVNGAVLVVGPADLTLADKRSRAFPYPST